jgi:hypothetical protein
MHPIPRHTATATFSADETFLREVSSLSAALNPDRDTSLSPEHDLSSIIGLAMRHGLGPLLYHNLRPFAGDRQIPPIVLDALRQDFIYSMFRSGRILEDANSVLRALTDAGIRCVALKGLHLATAFYPHPGLRPMGDLDVLVPQTLLNPAFDTLVQLGYSPVHPVPKSLWHHLPVLVKPGAVPVELHWTIARPSNAFEIDNKGMWERVVGPPASPVLSAEVLGLEDLVLHLCLHSTYHHRCRIALRNIFDIGLVIYHGSREIDWERLIEYAKRARVENAVFCGLLLANELFSADTPQRVLERLAPGVNRQMVLGYATAQLARFDLPTPTWRSALDLEQTLGKRFARLLSRAPSVWTELHGEAGNGTSTFRIARKYTERAFKAVIPNPKLVWGLLWSRPDARAHLDAARKSIWLDSWLEGGPHGTIGSTKSWSTSRWN